MSRARVSFGQVDLTSCDREPIHIPGCTQGHCALWAIELDRRVTARTENARALFAVDALGERLDVGFPPALASALSDALRRREALRDNPELIFSGALPTREGIEEECDVTAHVRADRLIVELERRARRYQGRVELVQKPGRFELAMQTQTRHFERAMPMGSTPKCDSNRRSSTATMASFITLGMS